MIETNNKVATLCIQKSDKITNLISLEMNN